MTYTITFADGRVIDGLTLSGNNFRSKTEITADMFADNLSEVHITAGGDTPDMMMPPPILHNAELVQILPGSVTPDGRWWFVLREIPEDEVAKAKAEKRFASLETANNDLVLMMADLIGG